MPEFTFPQYRKYTNNQNYFKIVSASEFEEIYFIGKKPIIKKHVAHILPDRNFIDDLLHDVENTCVICTKEEYHAIGITRV